MASKSSRAQASLEYATVIALVLAISLPLWIFVNDRLAASKTELAAYSAQDAVSAIARAADWVYLQGYPAKRTVDVTVPEYVAGYNVSGNEVLLRLSGPGGYTDVYDVTLANLTGDLTTRPGRVLVSASAISGQPGIVNISVVG